MRRLAAVLLGLAAATAVLAGCGDKAPGSPAASSSGVDNTSISGGVLVSSVDPSTFSPQKKAFFDAATAICDDSAARIAVAFSQADLAESSSPDHYIAFIRDTYVPMYQSRLDSLSALNPPPEDSDRVMQLLAESRSDLDKLSANPTGFLQTDPFTGVDIGFDTYGLTACGSRSG